MSLSVTIEDSLDNVPAGTVIVLPFFEGDSLLDVPAVTKLGGERLASVMERQEDQADLYRTTLLYPEGQSPGLLVIGAGNRDDLTPREFMRIAAAASRYLTGQGYSSFSIVDRRALQPFDFAHAAVEGAVYGVYDLGLKKTGKSISRRLDGITLVSESGDAGELWKGAELGRIVGESRSLARDLVNLPPNEITPSALAERARDLAEECGLEIEVLDEDAMRERGMGSLLGVSSGSQEPARLIVLRYGDRNADNNVAFVGKGLTFDSGGLSIKTAEGMETMKSDMAGAGAVIAGMVAIARLRPENVSATGYVGTTENMPGGAAMRPGDVLTAMNGETIEVLNTDAEGRLVLADVLSYAVEQGASHIVDFATLTGGAIVALGSAATLAVGNPTDWVARVVRAAERGFDRAWQMPLYREYREAMNSEIADIKNTSGRGSGASALTAAAFLADFASDVEWAHMDIAGTAFAGEQKPYGPPGATGEGVGTIVSVTRHMAEE